MVPDVTDRPVWDAVDPATRRALLARAAAELARAAPKAAGRLRDWVALDGVPVVVDVGQPTCTSAGPDRYQAWPLRSDWHNVPEPGAGQRPGSEYRARHVRAKLGVDVVELRADLAGAYPDGLVEHWLRTARLARNPAEIVLEEEWAPLENVVLLRHVLAGEVELGEGWALVRSKGVLRISWDPRPATAELDHRPIDDPLLRRSWGASLTRLTLCVRGVRSFTVRMARA